MLQANTRAEKETWNFTNSKAFKGKDFGEIPSIKIESQKQKFIFEALENGSFDALNISLDAGANLTHVRLHNGKNSSMYLRKINLQMAQNSTYNYFDLTTGFGNARTEIFANLHGENSHINVNSIALLDENNVADFLIHTNFKAENCTANIVNKNLVADSAHAVFQGKFLVEKTAQKTDAFMLCSNILLSEKGRVSHKPELEIYADDVKCSHGATTGQLNENQLFYLQARGLNLAAAKQILIEAQIASLINKIDDTSSHKTLEIVAKKWLKKVTKNEI